MKIDRTEQGEGDFGWSFDGFAPILGNSIRFPDEKNILLWTKGLFNSRCQITSKIYNIIYTDTLYYIHIYTVYWNLINQDPHWVLKLISAN